MLPLPRVRPARALVPAVALALVLTGCSGTDDPADDVASVAEDTSSIGSESASDEVPTESPTADVEVPDGVEATAQGTDLAFGDAATVVFEPDQKRDTLLDLKVTKAREGSIDDFEGFILDDEYKKKANYFYVDVTVENLGDGNVGGSPVPLWGVNGDNTLLPAVNFTTAFKPCASTALPKKFKTGDRVKTCLVYLSPDNGSLESISFRPDQAFDPIEWTGDVEPAPKDEDKGKNKQKNNKNPNG